MAKVSKKSIKQSNKKKSLKKGDEKGFNTPQILIGVFLITFIGYLIYSSKKKKEREDNK